MVLAITKSLPIIGWAAGTAAHLTALTGLVSKSLKAATAIVGLGKIAAIPTLLVALAYFNYDLFDPENRPFTVEEAQPEYDFIIAGGGTAGSILASRLSEVANWKVLLIEAGGHETDISDVPILSLYLHKSKLDWKYRTQPQNTACQAMQDHRCCWTRGKVLGGSSVLNTMLYVRGNKRDFDLWAALGNPGWSYEEVLPYFRKSEDQRNPYLARNKRQHGVGGYMTVQDSPYNTPLGPAFLQAGEEMGYDIVDINGEQQTGFAFFQFTMRRGSRLSMAKGFLRPVRLRKNLDIILYSQVTKILFDESGKVARGVEFYRKGKYFKTYAKREVILSSGTINSPQLLMLSGIGPAQHLSSLGINPIVDLPGVGQNIQDHIAVGGLMFQIDQPISTVINRLVNINSAIRYAATEDGPLTTNIGLESVAFINTKYANASDDWPDIEFMMTSGSTPSDGGSQVKRAHGLKSEFYDDMYSKLNHRDVFGIFPMMLRPKSRGFIKLASKNPHRYPLIYHNYLTHPDDVDVLREGVKTALALGETQAMKRFGARFYDKQVPNCRHLAMYTDEYWNCHIRQYTMTIYHMSGSCKMGPYDDKLAVVDHELRVHGVQNLRVIDASIMPSITNGNINAPTAMIAEKGADMIKQAWASAAV